MSALTNHASFISVVEYLHGEELSDVKHEYLNGVVHAMAGGTVRHGVIALNISSGLKIRLRGKSCRPHGSDTAVHFSRDQDERYYYPDASVTCGPFDPSARAVEAPVAIFEVLSPTTARIDRTEKKEAYLACASVQHYILVDPDRVETTIYTRETGGWKMTVYNELADELPLPAIEVSLSLAEIYEG